MVLNEIIFEEAKKHVKEMYDNLSSDFGVYRVYDVTLGFIDGFYWGDILDGKQATQLAEYSYGMMLEKATKEELENIFKDDDKTDD